MANTTSTVPMSITPWGDDKVHRDLSVATAATYYKGAMMALNSSGHAVKCDDTAGLVFDGIATGFSGAENAFEVATTDTLGEKKVTVQRPWRFGMKIASASATDLGAAVYAKYDNEVALYAGSTNKIQVGWIDKVKDSTFVIVRPIWTGANGEANFDGEDLTFTGSSGANDLVLPDNLADALSVQINGGADLLTFVTTNSGERIIPKVQTRLADSVKLAFGDGDDITVAWDGTDLDVLQAAANSSIKWGVDGAGIDQVFYGDTASTNMTWDQSADSLIFTGVAYVTGQKTKVTAKTTDYTLTAADSGGLLTTTGASGAVVFTLPTVAAGFVGTDVTIVNTVDQDMTVTAQTAGQIVFKNDAAANSVAYSTASEKIGGAFRCVCDGSKWIVMPLAEEAQTITVTT